MYPVAGDRSALRLVISNEALSCQGMKRPPWLHSQRSTCERPPREHMPCVQSLSAHRVITRSGLCSQAHLLACLSKVGKPSSKALPEGAMLELMEMRPVFRICVHCAVKLLADQDSGCRSELLLAQLERWKAACRRQQSAKHVTHC